MRFDKKYRPDKAAAKAESRYMINSVCLDKTDDQAVLVATDGRKLAVVPVDDAGNDDAGMIPADAIAQACKGRKKFPAIIDANGTCIVRRVDKPDEKTEYGRPETNFPDWRMVVPKPDKMNARITIDPFHLVDVATAMGLKGDDSTGLTLEIAFTENRELDSSKPIRLTPTSPSNLAYGVIMPKG